MGVRLVYAYLARLVEDLNFASFQRYSQNEARQVTRRVAQPHSLATDRATCNGWSNLLARSHGTRNGVLKLDILDSHGLHP